MVCVCGGGGKHPPPQGGCKKSLTKFDFGRDSAMGELTALPDLLAGFKVRDGKGRQGGREGSDEDGKTTCSP